MTSTEHPIPRGPSADDYLAAGFTVEQALELQRLNQRLNAVLLSQVGELWKALNSIMDRLKPEAWL